MEMFRASPARRLFGRVFIFRLQALTRPTIQPEKRSQYYRFGK
jgi:hypothetical protein